MATTAGTTGAIGAQAMPEDAEQERDPVTGTRSPMVVSGAAEILSPENFPDMDLDPDMEESDDLEAPPPLSLINLLADDFLEEDFDVFIFLEVDISLLFPPPPADLVDPDDDVDADIIPLLSLLNLLVAFEILDFFSTQRVETCQFKIL